MLIPRANASTGATGAPPRLGPWLSGLGFLASAALAVQVAWSGPLSFALRDAGGQVLAAWRIDAVSVAALLLITGVATVVQAFAKNYLRGDRRAGRFAVLATALTGASAAMVTADTLVVLALAWTATGAALCGLLGLYDERPEARAGVRRTAGALAIGDAALWIAVLLVSRASGQVTLSTLGEVADGAALPATIAALLIVVAAMARSAQLPFHGWLPATLSAPTPVSALLHAGVVNAGGLLLIKLSPLVGAVPVAMWTAAIVGACTLVYGGLLMLVRPDVKGALAHSTIAQMGFMVMTCGLGAYTAALVHLIAHGMYKANLFLGSGSAIAKITALPAPTVSESRPGRPAQTAASLTLAIGLPVVALAAAHAALSPVSTGGAAAHSAPLLVFAGLTGAWLSYGWLAGRLTAHRVAALSAVTLAAATGYVGMISGADVLLAPDLAAAGPAAASAWLLLPLLAVLAIAKLARSRPDLLGTQIGPALYSLVLHGASGRRAFRARPPRERRLPQALAFPVAMQRQESH